MLVYDVSVLVLIHIFFFRIVSSLQQLGFPEQIGVVQTKIMLISQLKVCILMKYGHDEQSFIPVAAEEASVLELSPSAADLPVMTTEFHLADSGRASSPLSSQ